MLIAILVALQVLDVITTNYALAHGAREANGIVKYLLDKFGTKWWIPKLAVGFLGTWLIAGSPLLLVVFTLIYGLVILSNLKVIEKLDD